MIVQEREIYSMGHQLITDPVPKRRQVKARLIGNTPLQPIDLDINGVVHRVHLKLEGANPGGSIKDRTAFALIRDLEYRKVLNRDSIIVASTSGNLGVALSMLLQARGYPFLAIIDPKTTQENICKMQDCGALLEMVRHPDESLAPFRSYLPIRLQRVRELCETEPRYVCADQYSHPANPDIHYTSTAVEIYRQMQAQVGAIFVATSTGGTLAGIGRFFRAKSLLTRVIGVDAYGSVLFGTPPAPYKLTGIGAARPSDFLTPEVYDTYHLVRDEEAFAFCIALYEQTGIKVGGSSGAVLAACAQYLARHPEVKHTVCICPDTGDNYNSTIFNRLWLQDQQIDLGGQLGLVQSITCNAAPLVDQPQ